MSAQTAEGGTTAAVAPREDTATPPRSRWRRWRRPLVLLGIGLAVYLVVKKPGPPALLRLPTTTMSPLGLALLSPGFRDFYRAHVDKDLVLPHFESDEVVVMDSEGRHPLYRMEDVSVYLLTGIFLGSATLDTEYDSNEELDQAVAELLRLWAAAGCTTTNSGVGEDEVGGAPPLVPSCAKGGPHIYSETQTCPAHDPEQPTVKHVTVSLQHDCYEPDNKLVVSVRYPFPDMVIAGPGGKGSRANPRFKPFINRVAAETDAILR